MTRRRTYPTLLLLALVWQGCASAPLPHPRLRRFQPEVLEEARRRAPALVARHRRFPFYILVQKSIDDHHMVNGRYALRYSLLRRYVVIDPTDRTAGSFSWTLPKHWRFTAVELRILPRRGPLRRFTLASLQVEEAGDGAYRYKLVYPRVEAGAVVEERLEALLEDALKHGDNYRVHDLSTTVPISRIEHHIYYPRNWVLQAKRLRESLLPLRVVRSEGERYHASCALHDLPGLPDEPFSPPTRQDGRYWAVRTQYLEIDRAPSYAPARWQDLAKIFMRHVITNEALFRSSVAKTTKRVIAGKQEPRERLAAIVRFAQDELRVDVEHHDRTFAEILQQRRGTPAQISALVALMARRAGLAADFALLHSAFDGSFDPAFVTAKELDTPAVVVAVSSATPLVVLPYLRHLSPGQMPWWIQGQPALAMPLDGSTHWWRVPVAPGEADRTEETFEVTIDEVGDVSVDETRRLHGIAGWTLRRELADLHDKELRRKLWQSRSVDAAQQLAAPRARQLLDSERPLELHYRYRFDSTCTATPQKVVCRPAGLLEPKGRYAYEADPETRLRPVHLGSRRQRRREVRLHFPRDWRLGALPKARRLSNGFGTMKISYDAQEPGLLRIVHELRLERGTHPASTINELIDLLGSKGRLRIPPLVFQRAPRSGASKTDAKLKAR